MEFYFLFVNISNALYIKYLITKSSQYRGFQSQCTKYVGKPTFQNTEKEHELRNNFSTLNLNR